VIKTEEEIEVLRYVAAASSAAHKVVMRKVRPGTKEYQAEAAFKNEVGVDKTIPHEPHCTLSAHTRPTFDTCRASQ
jgi:Xaa-Pro aminopeptidase